MTAVRKFASPMFCSGFLLIILGQALAPAAALEAETKQNESPRTVQPPDFEMDVAPIFQAKCLKCHGEKERKAELDLRTAAAVLKGGESGAVVVPEDPEKSLLYEKVAEGEMPPGKKDKLSETEVATIRRWIEAGARAGTKADADAGARRTQELNQHDVLPILLRRCTVCHGARQQEGQLDLRTKGSMLRGGKSGPAIIPGKPDDSLLIKKIRAGEMPPLTRLIEVSIKPIEPAETD
ncbi:MAG: c-type cytochrome domain-containing protein, partial [Deltaproteobacteria bacterium]